MRYLFRLLFAWAFVFALVFVMPVHAQGGTDLSGEWKGDSSGNHVTIEMRTGGFTVSFARQQQAGQSGGSLFFRDAGSGTYLHTFDSGPDATVQVLGANAIRVTNPDGWTDVFRRAPKMGAGSSPTSAPPTLSQSSGTGSHVPMAGPALARFLIGRWTDTGDCNVTIDFYTGGTFKLSHGSTGRWSVADTMLTFEGKAGSASARVQVTDKGAIELHHPNGSVGRSSRCGDTRSRTIHRDDPASEADAKYAAELGEYQRKLAAQQKAVADYNAAQRQMAADKAAAAARAKAAQEDFARQQAAYQAEQDRYARERAEYESALGRPDTPWKQQGTDARIIASDGKSAMDCVKLIQLTKTDSSTGGGGRVLSNQCSGPVEITWCYSPGDCDTETGSGWTVQAGKSWPVSADKNIRWAACHGADTAAFVKGSHGLSYYCKAPATK